MSAITTQFLEWCAARLQALGKRVFILVWDFVCPLPVKSPWLNPIEPKWVHSKRRIVEPERVLSLREVEEQVCAALG